MTVGNMFILLPYQNVFFDVWKIIVTRLNEGMIGTSTNIHWSNVFRVAPMTHYNVGRISWMKINGFVCFSVFFFSGDLCASYELKY